MTHYYMQTYPPLFHFHLPYTSAYTLHLDNALHSLINAPAELPMEHSIPTNKGERTYTAHIKRSLISMFQLSSFTTSTIVRSLIFNRSVGATRTMIRSFQRRVRQYRRECLSFWQSLSRGSLEGRVWITSFVFLGIIVFAILHTVFSMMVTHVPMKQTGYFDLYLENRGICWGNGMLNDKIRGQWTASLQFHNCAASPPLSLLTKPSPSSATTKETTELKHRSTSSVLINEGSINSSTSYRLQLRRSLLVSEGDVSSQSDSNNNSSTTLRHLDSSSVHTNTHKKSASPQHPIETNSSSNVSTSVSSIFRYDSIRLPDRLIFETNCTASEHSHHASQQLVNSGTCFDIPAQSYFFLGFQQRKVRCLPSFIIAGAMKSATGELMKWLDLHPFLKMGNGDDGKNEVHFFSRSIAHTIDEQSLQMNRGGQSASSHVNRMEVARRYVEYFPLLNENEAASIYTFEKSPDYMRDAHAMERIHHILPSVKLILILRNPSIRAVSEFNHHCRHHRFIKLIKSVKVGDWMYPKGAVLRNIASSRDAMEEKTEQDYFNIDTRLLPETSYITLNYPCTSEDMETYFYAGIKNNFVSSAGIMKQRTLENTNTTSSSSSSTHPLPIPSIDKLPREIIHGLYDVQIKHILTL